MKMNYKKYQHIEKLGTSEVEGILKGKCHLFYKIDETNSCIFLKEDNGLGFGSRNRELSLENDNAKFMNSIVKNQELYEKLRSYLLKYPERIIYGEWLVPVTIKRYKKDAWNHFYIFDIYDESTNKYVPYEEYKKDLDELQLNYIPEIATLTDATEEDIKKYLDDTGNYLIENGLGEGIVIKNYDYRNKYGRITWAKILTEDFLNSKKKHRDSNFENKQECLIEHKIVTTFLTPEFVQKEKAKLIETKGEWSSKMIFELLNRVFNEFWKDNWELVFKKFKYPTIDFKTLKRLMDEYVKIVLNI